MSAREAMAIGTAGYTAMLAVLALERHGITPGERPGRRHRRRRRRRIGGASRCSPSLALRSSPSPAVPRRPTTSKVWALPKSSSARNSPARPSRSPRSAGPAAIDAVGSTTLANVLSMTRYGGAVAACGLAGGMDLPTSVAPFILRGVCLYGIDSVMCPLPRRQEAWKRLETDLDRQQTGRNDQGNALSGVFEAASSHYWPARSAGGSWSRSGKRVQDLSTIVWHYSLGLQK